MSPPTLIDPRLFSGATINRGEEERSMAGIPKDPTGITKLIETLSEGIGVVGNSIFQFDARKIKRISAAKAEAEKVKIVKKAEGEADALAILDRAGKRFLLEQYNKQINLENIIVKSKKILQNEPVNDTPVDKDWATRFIDVAQDISDEDIQNLLAKILAGEIKQPRTFGRRTLDVIRNLSSTELTAFTTFAAFSSDWSDIYGGDIFITHDKIENTILAYQLDMNTYLDLCETGLLNPEPDLYVSFGKATCTTIRIAGTELEVIAPMDSGIEVDAIKFTAVGAQIARLLKPSPTLFVEYYIDDLVALFRKKKATTRIVSSLY